MPLQDTLNQLLAEARAANVSPGELVQRLTSAHEQDDVDALRAEIIALPMPDLSPADFQTIIEWLRDRTVVPVGSRKARRIIAAAMKSDDRVKFWRGLLLLAKIMSSQIRQHATPEAPNV